jgi:phosphate transport system substrate-binding protein
MARSSLRPTVAQAQSENACPDMAVPHGGSASMISGSKRLAPILAVAALAISACSGGASPAPSQEPAMSEPAMSSSTGGLNPPADVGKADSAQVTGAGSTAIFPFLSTIADAYQQNVAPGVSINYQSVGSGAGIAQFTAKTVDFGASDVYLSDDQEAAVGAPVLNIPMIHWAVAITYNLPGFSGTLNLGSDTVAKIYLGQITKWNDAAIAADNPGVSLPDTDITVAHRSDGSGTSFNFTSFLAGVSSDWQSQVGAGTSVNWPTGTGGKGSEGVTQIVSSTPGAIGYVELSYALSNSLPVASIKNAAGNFVAPTLDSTTDAVSAVVPNAPADLRFLIVNPPADHPNAYPIGASTWVLLLKDYPSDKAAEIKAMVDFLWWGIHDGQSMAAAIDYSAMAPNLVTKAEAALKSITIGGQPVLQ